MSSELLRKAAASEREEWGDPHIRRVFPKASAIHLALADWLDDAAARRYHTPTPPDHALTVARLIVGESDD